MSAEYMMLLPPTYPVFYVGVVNEWWTNEEFASLFTQDYTQLVPQDSSNTVAFVFASEKLGKGKGFAILNVSVAIQGENAFIRGIQHIGTYEESPDRQTKNEAYINMMSDAELNKCLYGRRYYLGEGDRMSVVKAVIVAWMDGEITESGSIPDYDFVEAF